LRSKLRAIGRLSTVNIGNIDLDMRLPCVSNLVSSLADALKEEEKNGRADTRNDRERERITARNLDNVR